jgi:hypothetical protein
MKDQNCYFHRGQSVESNNSSSNPFNIQPFQRDVPDDYALPRNTKTQDTEEEAWEDLCNCCGSWEESYGGCEEFSISPQQSKQKAWRGQVIKKRRNKSVLKTRAAPPKKNFRRVVYRRRFFRRERVNIDTGEKHVMLKPKISKSLRQDYTTFGWIPKKPGKGRGRKLRKKLTRCMQSTSAAISSLLLAPLVGFYSSTSNPKLYKLQAQTNCPFDKVNEGVNGADKQGSRRKKLFFWLPRKKQEVAHAAAEGLATSPLLGNEIEVAYDGSKNIISMPIEEPCPGALKQAFGDEVEVDYDGAKNTISVPLRKSYHKGP